LITEVIQRWSRIVLDVLVSFLHDCFRGSGGR
jgi:hypothetical protein